MNEFGNQLEMSAHSCFNKGQKSVCDMERTVRPSWFHLACLRRGCRCIISSILARLSHGCRCIISSSRSGAVGHVPMTHHTFKKQLHVTSVSSCKLAPDWPLGCMSIIGSDTFLYILWGHRISLYRLICIHMALLGLVLLQNVVNY